MTPEILEVMWLDIDQLHENQWNPNVMDDETMRLTRLSIEEEGFSDPVDVAPCDDKTHDDYKILDGEHRWRIAKQLGFTRIPVFVKNRYKDDAVITTIRKDRTHGEPDLVKLSEVVGDLVEELGPDEVHRRLGYDQAEQNALLDISKWDWAAYGTEEEDETGFRKAEEILWSVGLSKQARNWVMNSLSEYPGESEIEQFIEMVAEARRRVGIPDDEGSEHEEESLGA